MRRLLIALLGAIFLAGTLALGGCPADSGDGGYNGENGTEETTTTDSATDVGGDTLEGEVIPAAFTNDDEQIVCPVMGTVLASADEAIDHEDFNDKRYYFCCEGCPEKFRDDPEHYKDGKPADEAGDDHEHEEGDDHDEGM